jgi:tetratricopeptide (TPR) repeat protein
MAGRKVRHFPLCERPSARVTFDEALARIAQLPAHDPVAALRAGVALINADFPEPLLPRARAIAAAHPQSAPAQQLLGLAARASGESAIAYEAFRAAARIAPRDPLIAHSHARTALEAGMPAADLFAAAARLAPQDGGVLMGQAAALLQEGRPEEATAFLDGVLAANPMWIEGHTSRAALAGQTGGDPLAAARSALVRTPGAAALNHLIISLALQARDLPCAEAATAAAFAALGTPRWLVAMAAHVASEAGDLARAEAHFAAAGPPADAGEAALLARHRLRRGEADLAATLLDPWRGRPGEEAIWPLLALAWRLTDDPRWPWCEGDPGLVGVYDLDFTPEQLAALAQHLRTLHHATTPPLDQSVRGGTQTDGNLLLRTEPPIRDLKARLLAAAERHVAALPPPDPGHPTLLAARAPLRIAGSWSVRLTSAGFHTDHVHPQGWFSSALYLALPETLGTGADDHAGWLSLGEARDLVPGLAPLRLVEPRPGRLVLFPSNMWHGTRPFPAGERLTVAFDIARPRQDPNA